MNDNDDHSTQIKINLTGVAFIVMAALIAMVICIAEIVRATNNSQSDGGYTPIGYDEVSNYIIERDGIIVDDEKVVAYTATAARRLQFIEDKMLVRNLDGNLALFSGGGKIHLPLAEDPVKSDKKLIECLDPLDDGLLLRRASTSPFNREQFIERLIEAEQK